LDKAEVIARRILGWKMNRWDRWYDFENNRFIYHFNPEANLDHAMLIVEQMKKLEFNYSVRGEYEVCFNDHCSEGKTLAEAITNAAFAIAEVSSVPDEWL